MTGQLALPVSDKRLQSPEGLMTAALAWIDENPAAWSRLVRAAQDDAEECRAVFVKAYVEHLRRQPVTNGSQSYKLPNAFSAAFTRILREWHPELAPYIKANRSKLDGMTIPGRPY